MKFGRTYKIKIYDGLESPKPIVTVAYPLTLKFQVANNCQQSGNIAHFVLYNLSETARQAIAHDIFDQSSKYLGISFEAGYESEPRLTTAFVGDIQWAFSYRQGPDWITEIDAYDGGLAIQRAQVKLTATNGYNLPWLLRQMIATMKPYNIELGKISDFKVKSSRGLAVSGSTWSELVRIMWPYRAQCFINKGLVYVLQPDESLPDISPIKELSSNTGLVGTPRIAGTEVKATMIFEPRIEVGQPLLLKSIEPSIQIALNKYMDHKVVEVSHSGVISGSVSGEALTTVTFYLCDNAASVPAEAA